MRYLALATDYDGTLATDGLCCVFFWLYSLVVCGRPAPSEVAVDAGRGVEHHEAALGMVGVE